MQEWLGQVLESGNLGLLLLPISFLAGLITAITACCNYPVLGAVAGYAVSRREKGFKLPLLVCIGFGLSTAGSLAVAGALLGSLQGFSQYGRIIAGFLAIIFGLTALDLVPFKLPNIQFSNRYQPHGHFGSLIFGLVTGIVSSGSTFTCCAPLLWLALGTAAVQGKIVFGAIVMAMFALGFTFPVIAVMFGLSAAKLSNAMSKAAKPIRLTGGVLLIVMGFVLLFNL